MEKIELQNYLVKKFKEFNIKALLLNDQQVYHQDARTTCIKLANYENTELYMDIMSKTTYNTIRLISAHTNRLKELIEMAETDTFSLDKFVGYVTYEDMIIINNVKVATGRLTQYVMVDGKPYINTSSNWWNYCNACSEIIYDVNKQHDIGNNNWYVCNKCFNDKSKRNTTCPICGKKHFEFEMRRIYLGNESSLKNQVTNKFNIEVDSDNIRICFDCYEKYFLVCRYCGITRLKESEIDFCECRTRRVYDYDYKPKPRFLSTIKPRKNTLFLGFENECEIDTDRYDRTNPCEDCDQDRCDDCDAEGSYDIDYPEFVKALTRVLGPTVYCKWDGSLVHGFEIISEPMTYNYITKNRDRFKEAFKKIISLGAYSYVANTTGFHIHLSKNAFLNREHLLKFAYVIYVDKDLSEKIAKRSSNTYGYISEFKDKNELKAYIERSIDTPESRYQAVNFCNKNTIEVRIYKGNLSIESVMLYIQHVVSIFNYTALTVKQHTNVSIDNYVKYVYNRGSKFVELKKEIKRIKGGR